ncbi:MAG: hypothetical protein CYG59_01680 [Chloroflexi bacterium]|nr:MAG: hypothetical protein CYG59_01680 [Chloroflexota bacterium]
MLFGSRGNLKPELLAIVAIGLLPQRFRPGIVLHGDMYQPNTGLRGMLERLVLRFADRAIDRYTVQSAAEADIISRHWGIDRRKLNVVYVTYHPNATIKQLASAPRGQHIFAGGDSFRDFEPLVEAARMLPEYQFVIGTKRLEGRTDLPPNMQARVLSPSDYLKYMSTAAAVVVPLKKGLQRSAGQTTYQQSMWLKKLTIVTDALAVREYVEDGVTGLVVDGSPESYVSAIRWAFDPNNASTIVQIGEQAYARVKESADRNTRTQSLLRIVNEVAAERNFT